MHTTSRSTARSVALLEAAERRKTAGRIHDFVFVHSSFRTSSTWFWAAFRRLPDVCAYYEVFHETLASITHRDIGNHKHDAWRSGHPATEPYFVEYAPLIGKKGISEYSGEMAFERFIPSGGLSGWLTPGEQHYLKTLVGSARSRQLYPVLTCCRSLGRLGAIKRQLGGWNIFLYRNLFQQWMSYLGQFYGGNPYFVSTVAQTIRSNAHDPFFAFLSKDCLDGDATAREFGGFRDLDTAFRAFMGVHIYLSMRAFQDADQVVDANCLVRDQDYLTSMVQQIESNSGLRLDLADVRESVEDVGSNAYAPTDAATVIDELLATAAMFLKVSKTSQPYKFGLMLAEDCLDEEARYRYVRAQSGKPPKLKGANAGRGLGSGIDLRGIRIPRQKISRMVRALRLFHNDQ